MKRSIRIMELILVVILLGSLDASAARLTDVLDAADVNDDPLDFTLSLDFTQEYEWAEITRERNTLSSVERTMLNQTEFVYESVKNLLDINGTIGLYQDLEFHFTLPVHISETYKGHMSDHWRSKYWGGEYNPDTLHQAGRPSLLQDHVFGFAEWESTHAGFGDMTFGFSYSAVSGSRDKDYPSWLITLDFQVPSGGEQSPKLEPSAANELRGIGNDISVGKKLFAMIFKTAISYRWDKVEPYFGVHYKLPFSLGGYIEDPRHEGGFLLGTEAIAYEIHPEGDNEPLWKVAFDFRMSAVMFGRGQDYNAITDALAWRRDQDGDRFWPTDPRATDDPAQMFYYYPDAAAPEYELPIEDRYTYVEGLVGFYSILYHYIMLRWEVSFGHRTEHYLSLPDKLNYDTLRPLNMSGYNTQINEIGSRVKLAKSFVLSYTLSLGVTY